jgi:hypothetical protein
MEIRNETGKLEVTSLGYLIKFVTQQNVVRLSSFFSFPNPENLIPAFSHKNWL